MQYGNPVSLNDIDFAAFGEEFIPFVDSSTGKAFFEVSFAKDPLPIDRTGITSVIPAETLAKYIFDESIPLATRKEVFEGLLYTKDIKLREGQVLYKNQPVTEDVIASVLKSVTESVRGSINSTYRANVPLNTATTIDIPYYDQNGKVQYNTLEAVDYLKKYFTTPARLEETTAPYFNLDITPEEQIAFQADVERLSEQTSKTQLTAVQDLSDLFEKRVNPSNALDGSYSIDYFDNGKKIGGLRGSVFQNYLTLEYINIDKKYRDLGYSKFMYKDALELAKKQGQLGLLVGGQLTTAYKSKATYKNFTQQELSQKNERGEPITVLTEWLGVEPSTSVKEGVSEQKVPKTSNSAKPISLQLDLISLSDQVANQLKEDIISKGLGATFNIQESVDSNITETISKGKQNSCK